MRKTLFNTLFLISSAILQGCGSYDEEIHFYAPRVEVYKEKFQLESNDYVGTALKQRLSIIDTAEADLGYGGGGQVVAQCSLKTINGRITGRLVTVDTTFFKDTFDFDERGVMVAGAPYGEVLRHSTVFHEFGHCALDRLKHNCASKPNGYPASIMHTYVVNSSEFVTDYRRYIDELFINSEIFPKGATAPSGATSETVIPFDGCAGESGTASLSASVSGEQTHTFFTKCVDMNKHKNSMDGRSVPNIQCWHE
ncbi:hypothetical protein [Bdellovibrio sp. BCCA]|uniref:hypothetical protein n=1 Tax=Bdellovibrio sp. BCCA TaxID=3136281 RepID=UPI0030EFEF5D